MLLAEYLFFNYLPLLHHLHQTTTQVTHFEMGTCLGTLVLLSLVIIRIDTLVVPKVNIIKVFIFLVGLVLHCIEIDLFIIIELICWDFSACSFLVVLLGMLRIPKRLFALLARHFLTG